MEPQLVCDLSYQIRYSFKYSEDKDRRYSSQEYNSDIGQILIDLDVSSPNATKSASPKMYFSSLRYVITTYINAIVLRMIWCSQGQ